MALANAEVACVGDNCVDVADGPARGAPSARVEFPGGNALNVAVELARAGLRVAYHGAVGEDAQGGLIIDTARAAGVETTGVRRVAGRTGRTVVRRNDAGERRFVSEDYGVAASYRLDAATVARIAAGRWAHFARQSDLADWLTQLRSRGTSVSCDLGFEGGHELLPSLAGGLDAVFLSSSAEAHVAPELLLKRALAAGPALAVVTMGADGSLAATTERRWHIDAVAVAPVIDSLGAGDAYIAAFIAARLRGQTVDAALHAASAAGADACTRWGLAAAHHSDEEIPA